MAQNNLKRGQRTKRHKVLKRTAKVEKAVASYHIKNDLGRQIGMITIKSSFLKHLIGKQVKIIIYQSKNEI